MSEQPRYEREEKEEEKEEKSWDEKWRRDPLGMAVWPLILIWAGLVLLAQNLGLLAEVRMPEGLGPLQWWAVFLAGAGVILLLDVLVRLAVPAYRRPVGGTLILGVILLAIGLGQVLGKVVLWPLVLVAIGLFLIVRALLPRRRDS